ncbi:MAG: hypothetical protein FJZ07_01900 [Candidatus Nealsonbacteria bacterium]|nr:hypothetical protein [Candidatus Nealsonbacteria bacterium]
MYTGALYNSFVTFIAGIVSLIVFFQLGRLRKKREIRYSRGVDYFLLLYGLLWIFVGIRVFFDWLGLLDLDMFIWDWFTGPMTYIHIVPGFFYFAWSLFKRKGARYLFIGSLIFGTILCLYTFFRYGSIPGELTYWGTKPVANELTQKVFILSVFLPILLAILTDFFRRLKRWLKTKNIVEKQIFGFNAAFLIYASIAIFDALALAPGWKLLLVRIGVMISALIFYLSANIETED